MQKRVEIRPVDRALSRESAQQKLAVGIVVHGLECLDRFAWGERDALSSEQLRGARLFRAKASCSRCHPTPLFTDEQFHNTGVSWGSSDLGRFTVTGEDQDRGKFNPPSLRNVAQTAPYMHDGSLRTLEEVIEFYDGGGNPNPYLDRNIEPLRLSAEDKRALVAFLEGLTTTRR